MVTAADDGIDIESLPSISTMISLGFSPALAAGVPGRGETTVRYPFLLFISTPIPPNFPDISSPRSLAATGGRNAVYGSP